MAVHQTCFDWFKVVISDQLQALTISTNAGNKKRLAQLGVSHYQLGLSSQVNLMHSSSMTRS